MSAFLCSEQHIAMLANFASCNDIYLHAKYYDNPDATKDAGDIAQALARENINSINARYPDSDTEGDNLFILNCRDIARKGTKQYQAVEIIKAAQCFEYQACEHDEWNTSDAKTVIDKIISAAIRQLPGYDAAPWGF